MTKKNLFLAVSLCGLLITLVHFAKGEGFRYEAKGKRDPFVPLIGPDRTVVTDLDDIVSAEELTLEGIAVGPRGRAVAVINGEMLKEGDKIGNLEIKKISRKSVAILMGGKPYEIKLPEEGGYKGEK